MFAVQSIPDAPPGRPKRRYLQVRGLADAAVAAKVHGAEAQGGRLVLGERLAARFRGRLAATDDRSRARRRDRPRNGPRPLAPGARRGEGPQPAGRRATRFFLGEEDVGEGLTDASGRAVRRATKWVVVGILKSEGTTFGSELWAKQSLVAPLFGKDTFTSLLVRAPDGRPR